MIMAPPTLSKKYRGGGGPFEFLCTPLYLIMITMAKPRPLLEVSEPVNKEMNRENRERYRE